MESWTTAELFNDMIESWKEVYECAEIRDTLMDGSRKNEVLDAFGKFLDDGNASWGSVEGRKKMKEWLTHIDDLASCYEYFTKQALIWVVIS